jgi:hypothetical protein
VFDLNSKDQNASPRSKGLLDRIFSTYNDVSAEEAKKKKEFFDFKFKMNDHVQYNGKYPNYLQIDKSENLEVLDPANDFWF